MPHEPDLGAPVRFGFTYICACDATRTYCSRTEGDCPWWDREPVEPDFVRTDHDEGCPMAEGDVGPCWCGKQ